MAADELTFERLMRTNFVARDQILSAKPQAQLLRMAQEGRLGLEKLREQRMQQRRAIAANLKLARRVMRARWSKQHPDHIAPILATTTSALERQIAQLQATEEKISAHHVALESLTFRMQRFPKTTDNQGASSVGTALVPHAVAARWTNAGVILKRVQAILPGTAQVKTAFGAALKYMAGRATRYRTPA